MSKDNPLSACGASPFSRSAMHCGKGDTASAAGRPLRGDRWRVPCQFHAPCPALRIVDNQYV